MYHRVTKTQSRKWSNLAVHASRSCEFILELALCLDHIPLIL